MLDLLGGFIQVQLFMLQILYRESLLLVEMYCHGIG
jgi:hypothetical protein